MSKRKWKLEKVGEIDERALRVILRRLCDMAVVPDNYDEELIIATFDDGKFVRES